MKFNKLLTVYPVELYAKNVSDCKRFRGKRGGFGGEKSYPAKSPVFEGFLQKNAGKMMFLGVCQVLFCYVCYLLSKGCGEP